MLTYQKAQKLIALGDTVYTVQGGQVVEHKVTKLYADSLDTTEDIFFYEDVGREWFLTRRGALDYLAKTGGRKNEICTYKHPAVLGVLNHS